MTLSSDGPDQLVELSPERKQLYTLLCSYYGVRWFLGIMTMMSSVDMAGGITLPILHLLGHEATYIVGSMGGYWSTPAPYHLTTRDYVAASTMVLAGILQHGAELQRWWFKRDPSHKGQLHTSGLFRYARFVNHTGHIMRDLAVPLFVPNTGFWVFYLFGLYHLWFMITPETIDHMKTKYGSKYEDYAKKTPSLFLPGIF